MAHLSPATTRHGAVAGTLLSAAVALAFLVWMVSIIAAAIDSVLVALVVTMIVPLPLASPLARPSKPRR